SWHADGVMEALGAAARAPDQGRSVELVAGHVAFVARIHAAMEQARDCEQLAQVADHLLHVFELERLLPVLERARALEVQGEAAARREVEEGASFAALLAARTRKHGAAAFDLFLIIEGPWRDQPLPRELAYALLLER